MTAESADPSQRRGRVKRTKPGPNGRMSKTKKRARPVLGLVTLYHFTTGEPREFYPVDADVQLKAGTYLRQPSGVSLQQAAPVTQGKPRRGRPPKEQPGATQAQVASSQASPVALQQQEPNGD